MMFLSGDKQADIIDAYNTTSRYLDDILTVSCWHGGLIRQGCQCRRLRGAFSKCYR